MARQVNTGGNYKIVGQDITIGGMNADPFAYSDSGAFPFRSVAYSYVPSLFDGIEAVRQHNNGVFPTSDYTALWYDTDNWGSDPVFGIRVLYNGTTFNLQYNFRIYNSPDYVWADNLWYNNSWDDGYTGADPSNITQEDRWRLGIYIAYMTDGISFMPTANSAKYVVVYAHKAPVTGYTGAPGTTSFAMATGYPGDRWYVDSGPCYYESSGGVMLASPVPGVLCILQSALATKIETFTDDTATPGGGHGNNYGYYSLPVGVPGLPQISIMDTGMAQMWHASPSQCNDLADYLWSDDFFDNIKKVNADPLANIIQFGVVPIDVSVLNGTLKEVKVGNVATGVNMYPLTHQYIQLELGSINPEEYWTSFMDYEPMGECMYKLQKYVVRRLILDEGKRVDGRSLTDVRPLASEVGVIPRVHGSGLFTRGQTQVLTICTLGTMRDAHVSMLNKFCPFSVVKPKRRIESSRTTVSIHSSTVLLCVKYSAV